MSERTKSTRIEAAEARCPLTHRQIAIELLRIERNIEADRHELEEVLGIDPQGGGIGLFCQSLVPLAFTLLGVPEDPHPQTEWDKLSKPERSLRSLYWDAQVAWCESQGPHDFMGHLETAFKKHEARMKRYAREVRKREATAVAIEHKEQPGGNPG